MKKSGIRELCSKENREKWVLFATTLYIFARILFYSLYSESRAAFLFSPVFYLCYFIAVLKIFLEIWHKEYRIKEILLIGGLSIFLLINMRITGIRHAFLYWIFIVASRGVNYKKLMKWAAVAHFFALLIIIASSYAHILDNIPYVQDERVRYSLGFSYTSAAPNFFLYAVLLWIFARDEKITYSELAGLSLIGVFLYSQTVTFSAFILTQAALAIDLLLKLIPSFRKWRSGYKWPALLFAPLAAAFILLVTIYYDPSVPWMGELNKLVHSRLGLGKAGIDKYGVPLFGQFVTWIGGTATHLGLYNYVDSSFVQTLISYGWVFFSLLLMGLIRFGKAIADHKDIHLLLAFCVLILHATFDPQLIWIMFNSFWVAYAYIAEKQEPQDQKPKEKRRRWVQPALAALFAGLIAAAILIPDCSKVLNRALYLDPKNQGYDRWLLNANFKVVGTEDDTCLLTTVSKTGFGEVTPDDLAFYVQASKRMHPEISRTTLSFTDGTGVEISFDQPDKGKYGNPDEAGTVTGDIKQITLSQPLGTQIDGITTYLREYDTSGNIIYQFHVDANGNGIADSAGIAGYRRSYDTRHRILTEEKIGADGNPWLQSGSYYKVRYQYEKDRSNWIYLQYLDASGNPVRAADGYAAIRRTYDAKGNLLSESYLNEQGNLINNINGTAKEERRYNENNRLISMKTYDETEKPAVTAAGYAEIRREYDDRGNIIRESYYGSDGQPITRTAGYASIEQVYDDSDRLIARRYLGSDGQSVMRTDGYSEARWILNEVTGAYELSLLDENRDSLGIDGMNLARDIPGDTEAWSSWMHPTYNVVNSCMSIGSLNLADKNAGEAFTCQVEIEFRDVQATEGQPFRFWSQGSADGKWNIGNVWTSNLVYLENAPRDGVYLFTVTNTVNEAMVSVSNFDMGFRCDYWTGGYFRIRKVKVEKGDSAGSWTPGI